MKNDPIIKEVLLDAPVGKVWKAITDREEMEHWYFKLKEFKPETGFEFSFEGGTEERTYVHLCRITDVIPQKKLAYTWQYEGLPGVTKVIWELFPEGNRTRLRLTHEGIENLSMHGPDFAKTNFSKGWEAITGTNLKNWIEREKAIGRG